MGWMVAVSPVLAPGVASCGSDDDSGLGRPGSLVTMSTVELDERALEAARREAERRGVDVSEVVSTAVRRFVAGADLSDLLAEFRRRDEASLDALSEEEALRIADEQLDAFRSERS